MIYFVFILLWFVIYCIIMNSYKLYKSHKKYLHKKSLIRRIYIEKLKWVILYYSFMLVVILLIL